MRSAPKASATYWSKSLSTGNGTPRSWACAETLTNESWLLELIARNCTPLRGVFLVQFDQGRDVEVGHRTLGVDEHDHEGFLSLKPRASGAGDGCPSGGSRGPPRPRRWSDLRLGRLENPNAAAMKMVRTCSMISSFPRSVLNERLSQPRHVTPARPNCNSVLPGNERATKGSVAKTQALASIRVASPDLTCLAAITDSAPGSVSELRMNPESAGAS